MVLDWNWMFSWVILPLIIFLARICDVSIGTMRVIFVSKGYKRLAPLLGFFEVLIWVIAIGQIMQNLENPACYLAYAAGFAVGNYMGIIVENRLSLGLVLVRIITQRDATELLNHLKEKHFGVTTLEAVGLYEKVKIIFTVINRESLALVLEAVDQYNPNAFFSVEDIRTAKEGVFPLKQSLSERLYGQFTRFHRLGK